MSHISLPRTVFDFSWITYYVRGVIMSGRLWSTGIDAVVEICDVCRHRVETRHTRAPRIAVRIMVNDDGLTRVASATLNEHNDC